MVRLTVSALIQAGADPTGRMEVGRRCGFPGAWIRRTDGGFAKLGAVGVHFHRYVSLHGLALNVDPEPWGFRWIVPCGLSDEATSIRLLCEELGGDTGLLPSIEELGTRLAALLPTLWQPGVCDSCPRFD